MPSRDVCIHGHHFYSSPCVYAQSLSLVRPLVTLWTVAHQAPLSVGFSRQDYWVVFSFSMGSSQPRDRTHVTLSPAVAIRFFTTAPPGKLELLTLFARLRVLSHFLLTWEPFSLRTHTSPILFGKSHHKHKRKCCFGIPPKILILT